MTVGEFLAQKRGFVDDGNRELVRALEHDGYIVIISTTEGLVWEATQETQERIDAAQPGADAREGGDAG